LYGSGCGSGSSDPYLWLTDPDATRLAEEVKKLKAELDSKSGK
jgi:hypothetical protein